MSMRQTPEAKYLGFAGPVQPVYPQAVRRLAWALAAKSELGPRVVLLDRVIESCKGYSALYSDIRTSDGYVWWRVAEFSTIRGIVLVAIPKMNDASKADAVRCDRSPAVYLEPGKNLTAEFADAIVRILAEVLVQAQGLR